MSKRTSKLGRKGLAARLGKKVLRTGASRLAADAAKTPRSKRHGKFVRKFIKCILTSK